MLIHMNSFDSLNCRIYYHLVASMTSEACVDISLQILHQLRMLIECSMLVMSDSITLLQVFQDTWSLVDDIQADSLLFWIFFGKCFLPDYVKEENQKKTTMKYFLIMGFELFALVSRYSKKCTNPRC